MRHRFLVLVAAAILIFVVHSCSDNGSEPIEGGLTMNEAVQIVQDSLPGIVPPNTKYFCLKMGGPVSKGSTIAEASPDPLPGSPQLAPKVALALTEDTYFFYLDLEPNAFFEHPVKYITIGKNSGSYGVTDANWWPEIDDETPAHILDDFPDSQYIVDTNVTFDFPEGFDALYEFPVSSTQISEGFIVVQGLLWGQKCFSDATKTYVNGLDYFNAYKNANSRVQGIIQHNADTVRELIDEMAAEGRKVITIYIIAHGSVDRIGLGGYAFYPSHFAAKMAAHPDVLFNFLLGSCHSGSFIDDLQVLPNVRFVATACQADESAWPDWDVRDGLDDINAQDTGSEWTSSLIVAMAYLRNHVDHWSLIREWALVHDVPVTSILLREAFAGALGQNAYVGLTINYDLSNRTGDAHPQAYRSW